MSINLGEPTVNSTLTLIMKLQRYRVLLYVVVLALCSPVQGASQGASLRGVVVENEEHGRGIAYVKVTVDSGKANPVGTDSNGSFLLEFEDDMRPGDSVQLRVQKQGWVVVNWTLLKTIIPSQNELPLVIILSKPEYREIYARQYYNLKGIEVVESRYREQIARLQGEHEATSRELERIAREREVALAQVTELSTKLARLPNEEFDDESYTQALKLFLKGDVNQAIDLLNETDFTAEIAQQKKKLDQLARELLLKAHLQSVAFDFVGANNSYKLAIKSFPDNLEVWLESASYWYQQKEFKESRFAYEKALTLLKDIAKEAPEYAKYGVVAVFSGLGMLNSVEGRTTEARAAYEEALALLKNLTLDNPLNLDREIAEILIALGELNHDEGRMIEARAAYEEAMDLLRGLPRGYPEFSAAIARALNQLGNLNLDEQRMEEARAAYEEALDVLRVLAKDNPTDYQPDVAITLHNMGSLNLNQGKMVEARAAYEEALVLKRKLAKYNPESYLPSIAITLNNLGVLHSIEGRVAEARAVHEEALSLRRELANVNPEIYQSDVATSLHNLGTLYFNDERMVEARAAYDEALALRRKLAEDNPQIHLTSLAQTLSSMGELYFVERRMSEARAVYEEALQLHQHLDVLTPLAIRYNIINLYVII